MKNFVLLKSIFILAALSTVVGCNKDKTDDQDIDPTKITENQLGYFQRNLVQINSTSGDLESRANGVPLTQFSLDTTVVFIGVDNIEEAKKLFKTWMPQSNADIVEKDNTIVFSPKDEDNKAQGKVTFAPVSDPEGKIIASVTFSENASVKYISRVNFIINSAWPLNGSSAYNIGEIYEALYSPGNQTILKYVCVKKAESGKPGFGITLFPYGARVGGGKPSLDYSPTVAEVEEFAKILQGNWGGFANIFEKAGMPGLNNDSHHQYYIYHKFYVLDVTYHIDLKTSKWDYIVMSISQTHRGSMGINRFGMVY